MQSELVALRPYACVAKKKPLQKSDLRKKLECSLNRSTTELMDDDCATAICTRVPLASVAPRLPIGDSFPVAL